MGLRERISVFEKLLAIACDFQETRSDRVNSTIRERNNDGNENCRIHGQRRYKKWKRIRVCVRMVNKTRGYHQSFLANEPPPDPP